MPRPKVSEKLLPNDGGRFDPARWMDLYCGLANARHALEFWEREYAVAARRGGAIPRALLDCCRERGRKECETLAELERLVRPLACRDTMPSESPQQ